MFLICNFSKGVRKLNQAENLFESQVLSATPHGQRTAQRTIGLSGRAVRRRRSPCRTTAILHALRAGSTGPRSNSESDNAGAPKTSTQHFVDQLLHYLTYSSNE